ncbi:TetR/AcrR family transcriptional regulator [Vreelandella sp. EE27]
MQTKAGNTQERGRIRRQRLLKTAESLLNDQAMDTLTLSQVAEAASIPKASAYHFYKDINDLYGDLYVCLSQQLENVIATCELQNANEWSDVLSQCIQIGATWVDQSTSRRQLMWNGNAPFSIRQAGRAADFRLGNVVLNRLREQFVIPDAPQLSERFFRGMQIADLFFTLSLLEEQVLTRSMITEACHGTVGYMKQHLPCALAKHA